MPVLHIYIYIRRLCMPVRVRGCSESAPPRRAPSIRGAGARPAQPGPTATRSEPIYCRSLRRLHLQKGGLGVLVAPRVFRPPLAHRANQVAVFFLLWSGIFNTRTAVICRYVWNNKERGDAATKLLSPFEAEAVLKQRQLLETPAWRKRGNGAMLFPSTPTGRSQAGLKGGGVKGKSLADPRLPRRPLRGASSCSFTSLAW
jgi:hypothetical protein